MSCHKAQHSTTSTHASSHDTSYHSFSTAPFKMQRKHQFFLNLLSSSHVRLQKVLSMAVFYVKTEPFKNSCCTMVKRASNHDKTLRWVYLLDYMTPIAGNYCYPNSNYKCDSQLLQYRRATPQNAIGSLPVPIWHIERFYQALLCLFFQFPAGCSRPKYGNCWALQVTCRERDHIFTLWSQAAFAALFHLQRHLKPHPNHFRHTTLATTEKHTVLCNYQTPNIAAGI